MLQLIRDGDAVLDPDRLPWLADEPAVRNGRRWFPLLFWPVLVALLVGGASFWLGTRGPLWPNGSSDIARTSPDAATGKPAPAASTVEATQDMPLPPLPEPEQGLGPLDGPALPPPPAPTIRPPATRSTSAGDPPVAASARGSASPKPDGGCPSGSPGGTIASCGDAYLARLDQHLASLYSQSWARSDAERRAQLLRSQDRFVARLDGCRSDSCKRGVYLTRMKEVSDIMTGKWQPPRLRVPEGADAARLDRQLRSVFNQSWAGADAEKRALLLRSHNRFLDRLQSCRSEACANSAYSARISEVGEIVGSTRAPSQ